MSRDMNGHGHAWERVNTNGDDCTDAHAEHGQDSMPDRAEIRLGIRGSFPPQTAPQHMSVQCPVLGGRRTYLHHGLQPLEGDAHEAGQLQLAWRVPMPAPELRILLGQPRHLLVDVHRNPDHTRLHNKTYTWCHTCALPRADWCRCLTVSMKYKVTNAPAVGGLV